MEKSFKGRLRVLGASDEKLCRVEILALNDKVNANGWKYTNLSAHLSQFQDIPILTAYTNAGDGIGAGHNFTMRKDEDGEEYCSFTDADAERIVGWVPGDADVHLTQGQDAEWIVVTGALWRWYSRELVDKITAAKGGMEVSIETLVTASHTEPDGTEVEEEYIVLGITVLGNGTAPAVKGAGIRRLNEARKRMKPEIEQAAEMDDHIAARINEDRRGGARPAREHIVPRSSGGSMAQASLSCRTAAIHLRPSPTGDHMADPCPPNTENLEKNKTERSNAMDAYEKDVALNEAAPKAENPPEEKDKAETVPAEKETDKAGKTDAPKDCRGGAAPARKGQEDAGKPAEETNEPEAKDAPDAEKQKDTDAEKEALKKENAALKARLDALEAVEKQRRCSAAADSAASEFERINRLCTAEAFDEELISGIRTLAQEGGYSEYVDAEGHWYGDAEARKDVRALCMGTILDRAEGNAGGASSAPTVSHRADEPGPAPMRYHSWSLAQNSAGREDGATVIERLRSKAGA